MKILLLFAITVLALHTAYADYEIEDALQYARDHCDPDEYNINYLWPLCIGNDCLHFVTQILQRGCMGVCGGPVCGEDTDPNSNRHSRTCSFTNPTDAQTGMCDDGHWMPRIWIPELNDYCPNPTPYRTLWSNVRHGIPFFSGADPWHTNPNWLKEGPFDNQHVQDSFENDGHANLLQPGDVVITRMSTADNDCSGHAMWVASAEPGGLPRLHCYIASRNGSHCPPPSTSEWLLNDGDFAHSNSWITWLHRNRPDARTYFFEWRAFPAQHDFEMAGNWVPGNGEPELAGENHVLSGTVLEIWPGVHVQLSSGASIVVDAGGSLAVHGTAANPVVFEGEGTGTHGLQIYGDVQLSSCNFHNVNEVVMHTGSTVTITNELMVPNGMTLSIDPGVQIAMGEGASIVMHTGSSMTLEDELTVPSGATLTIDPGVQIAMGADAIIDISSGGHFTANGTENSRIQFSGTTNWANLYLRGSNYTLSWCNISGAACAIIAGDNSNVSLSHCAITHSGQGAWVESGSTLALDQCSISESTDWGIGSDGRLTLTGGEIFNSGCMGIWTQFGSTYIDGTSLYGNGTRDRGEYAGAAICNTSADLTLHCATLTNNWGPGLTCFGGFTGMGTDRNGSSKNVITGNMAGYAGQTQIYFEDAQFGMCNGRNMIYGATGEQIHDATPVGHEVTGNCWNSRHQYPPQYYNGGDDAVCDANRCSLSNWGRCTLDGGESGPMYQLAWEQENTMLWDVAVETYKEILTDYPNSPEAKLCPGRITFCETFGSKDWSTQRSYFLQMARDSAKDEALRFECKASAAWCLVELGDIQGAQNEFLALLDSADTYYKYEVAALYSLMAELKEQQGGVMQTGGSSQAERINGVLSRMQEILNNRPDFKHGTPLPTKFALFQNYPNPFNAATEIRFDLPEAAKVELRVFNTLGQLVTTLVNDNRVAGAYRVQWNAKNAASGVYICQLKAGNFTSAKKMMLMK